MRGMRKTGTVRKSVAKKITVPKAKPQKKVIIRPGSTVQTRIKPTATGRNMPGRGITGRAPGAYKAVTPKAKPRGKSGGTPKQARVVRKRAR